jgi:drug/metabolite transporter (DMT)-like permease
MAVSRVVIVAAVAGLVCFGALNTLTTKIQFTLVSIGSAGVPEHFEKPWFATFAMFAGMAFVLLPHYMSESRQKKVMASDSQEELLPRDEGHTLSEFQAFLYVGIPAGFDLVASGLMFGGLIYISASIWQMLRGSEIVFAAIISVPGLGAKLYCYHWIGILLCMIGICLVGWANVLNSQSTASGASASTSDALFGMALVVAAQVVQAAQMVVEEKLLKDVMLPPMKIVGYEGVWGSCLCVFLVFPICWYLPGADNGHGEDIVDTLTMLKNDSSLVGLLMLYVFSCATYNVAGMAVTSNLSAVHRTMMEASRTLGIWLIDLCVHYLINKDISFGEAWMPYSYVQLIGFLVLLSGQSVYGTVLRIPGLYYPVQSPIQKWESPRSVLSPMPLPGAYDESGITIEESKV